MARICIVTPGALGSNPRVVKEADALVRAGHDVHVIATRSLAVVDAQRQLARARLSLAAAQGQRLTDLVSLYTALGADWRT